MTSLNVFRNISQQKGDPTFIIMTALLANIMYTTLMNFLSLCLFYCVVVDMFDALTGKPLGTFSSSGKSLKHNTELLTIALDYRGPSATRQLILLDKNHDLYITPVRSFGSTGKTTSIGWLIILLLYVHNLYTRQTSNNLIASCHFHSSDHFCTIHAELCYTLLESS